MDGADAGAGQHRVSRLRDHRQVDRDPVALLGATRLEHIRKPADLRVKLPVGDLAVLLWVVAFPDDGDLIAAPREMAIDAVVRHVSDAVLEPFDRYVVWIKRRVLDPGEWLEPVDAFGFPAPEAVRILDRTLVHGGISRAIDVGALAPFGGNFVDLLAHAWTP